MRVDENRIRQLLQNIEEGNIMTPSYVLDESMLIENLKILQSVEERTGCGILLAQKAFSVYQTYPLIGQYISGVTASGLYEARLGHEQMQGENHVFSPAYKKEELEELFDICDHIIFNSFRDWDRHRERAFDVQSATAGQGRRNGRIPEFGIRINPCYSTQEHGIYDPCAYGSRFGVRKEEFRFDDMKGIDGLHFHTLCEQNADDLKRTLEVVERDFAPALHQVKWVNLGGGHHITRKDYDLETLITCIRHLQETYDVQVYLEPGEAVVLDAGYMVSQVLDIAENGIKTAVLDVSAACHMPDIIEMPYTPKAMAVTKNETIQRGITVNRNIAIYGIGEDGRTNESVTEEAVSVFAETAEEYHSGSVNSCGGGTSGHSRIYRFGGNTCLAGDVFGDYLFERELKVGDRVIFFDMALYSIVKNNTFNGMELPAILYMRENGEIQVFKQFGYEDFKTRL